jgi:hypothetical protein
MMTFQDTLWAALMEQFFRSKTRDFLKGPIFIYAALP